jgi:hypothetical protein
MAGDGAVPAAAAAAASCDRARAALAAVARCSADDGATTSEDESNAADEDSCFEDKPATIAAKHLYNMECNQIAARENEEHQVQTESKTLMNYNCVAQSSRLTLTV